MIGRLDAGWSSPVARQAHNLKVVGSNPTPSAVDLFSKEKAAKHHCPDNLAVLHRGDDRGFAFSVGPDEAESGDEPEERDTCHTAKIYELHRFVDEEQAGSHDQKNRQQRKEHHDNWAFVIADLTRNNRL